MEIYKCMATTLQNEGDYAIFVSDSPLKDVETITGISDIVTSSASVKKEFAWSFDNKTYSEYFDSSVPENINAVNLPASEIWFKFRYTLESSGPAVIDSVSMSVTHTITPEVSRPNPVYNPYRIGNIKGTMFLNADGYNPYAVDELKQMAQGLSRMINRQWGIETNYYRATVDSFGTDVIMREYTLQNVQPAKCIKVVVPNNQFPDANFSFSPFGIDYSDLPFEVHIDKMYFEQIFGEGTRPQKRDIIFIPMMDKIFEIMDSFLHRNIMQLQLFYKVKLYKWSPKPTNVIVPTGTPTEENGLAQLAEITRNTETQFGSEQDREEKKVTNKQQLKKKTIRVDVLRTTINPNLIIEEKNLLNNFNVLTNFRYDLSSILPEPGYAYDVAVEYEQNCSWPAASNRTFAAWFKPQVPELQVKSYDSNFTSITKNTPSGTISLTLNQPIKNVKEGDEISIRSSRNGFSLPLLVNTIVKAGASWTYTCESVSDSILHYDTSTSSWTGWIEDLYPSWETTFSTTRPKFTKSYVCNYITGDTSFEISSRDFRYFRINVNEVDEWFDLGYALDPEWFHAICATVSSEFNQVTLTIYSQELSQNTLDIRQVFTELRNIDGKSLEIDTDSNYVLRAAPIKLSNIRLMDTIVGIDQQQLFLNQTIVQDADLGIIIDNAVPQSRAPYIGKTI
jgi:hypothetical protein